MKAADLIDSAANKVGSLRELGRQLDWNSGAIAGIKAGTRPLPPWRAAQLAEILGRDPKAAYIEAAKDQAIPEGERRLLGELLKVCKASAAGLTIAVTLAVSTLAPAKVDAAQFPAEAREYTLCIQRLRLAAFLRWLYGWRWCWGNSWTTS